mgnify:CR=1 FL=1
MRHAGTQELETDRLFLRRLLPEDADMMYANWASDPQVTRFLRWEPHKNALETLGLLAAWATLYPNPDYYQWAIVEKASGQVFGSIGIFNAGDNLVFLVAARIARAREDHSHGPLIAPRQLNLVQALLGASEHDIYQIVL